jgi:hypothetical protein
MAASIFVDPCIKRSHRKVSLMRGKPKPRTPFSGGWASALWSDVVGDYRKGNSESDESQVFLNRRRRRYYVKWFLDASKDDLIILLRLQKSGGDASSALLQEFRDQWSSRSLARRTPRQQGR